MKKDWKEIKIKRVSKTYSGGTPSRDNPNYYNGIINWVKSSELKNKYVFDTEEKITEEAIKHSSTRYVSENTVLFALYGATAGAMSILKKRACINQAILAIPILDDNKYFYEYIYYSLKNIVNNLISISQGGGQPNLTKGIVDNSTLLMPSLLNEQKAIAKILSTVDELIQVTKETIIKAERLKKSLMQNLLTGKLKPDGTWRTDDEFYEDEKYGRIPKTWSYKKLSSVLTECQYGLSKAMNETGKYPIFRMNNIENGKMVTEPMAYIDLSDKEFEKYKVNKGDILINRTNSLELVGKVGIFNLEGDYVFASYLIRLKTNEETDPYYINYYLNYHDGIKKIKSKVTPAISQANINVSNIKAIVIPLPNDIMEQEQISNLLNETDNQIENKKSKIKSLEKLKKSLMQNLLTGKKRINLNKFQELIKEEQN